MSEFYRNYLAVAVFIGAALLMVGAMLGVGRLIRPIRPQPEKLLSYEAVFVFPWAVRLESLGTFGLIEMLVFIVVLALGLVYAWRKGVLRWA